MSNDTREALAAKCKDLADTLYTGPVAHKAACVRLVHAAIDELAALTEQPAAPQPSNLGDSVERCGSPSGAVSGGSGIGAFDKVAFQLALNVRHKDCHRAADAFWEYWNANGETHKRGYYESTWGAINRAIRLVGVVPHDYGCGQPSQMVDSSCVAMGHVGREPSLEASVAGPEARPDQQSDSCAAPQGVQAEPLTDEQRLHLSQAAGLLEEYGEECLRGGADSTAAACGASAYVLRQLLYAAPAAPAQEPPPPPQRDPCPQCRPGVVCRTPKCGRLRVSSLAVLAKHGQPQGGKEAAQRERMAEKFANRATTQATADFDLPARSDVVQPQGGSNG